MKKVIEISKDLEKKEAMELLQEFSDFVNEHIGDNEAYIILEVIQKK